MEVTLVKLDKRPRNKSKYYHVYEILLNLPKGKAVTVDLDSFDDADRLKSAVYNYARRHGFNVSMRFVPNNQPNGPTILIERIDDDHSQP